MERALLWHRGPGLAPQLLLLHEVRQSRVLSRQIASTGSARPEQAQRRAIPRYLRRRRDRRSADVGVGDRKSTRLNSSHLVISYAVFCLKKQMYKVTEHNN